MKLRAILAAAVLSGLASSSFALDFYVAQDGSDTNSGLTRAQAKATIAAGYACLTADAASTVGARLILGDGDWSISSTIVLSNSWSLASENGPDRTTLTPASAIPFFNISSADSSVSGFTIDFQQINYRYVTSGLVSENSIGTITNCAVQNYKSTWGNCMVKISATGKELTFRDCDFANCYVSYRTAIFWAEKGKMHFYNCSFVACNARAASGTLYFNYGMIYLIAGGTLRNCLFRSCKAYGTYPAASIHSSIVSLGKGTGSLVENCTFISCSVAGGSSGGALACRTVTKTSDIAGTARNCLAFNCTNNNGPAGLMHGFTYTYCAQESELDGEGNVIINDANTVWQNALADRYIPTTGPAVDGGTRLDWMTDALDVRGFDRVYGAAPDIGCYEFTPPATYYVAKDGNDSNPGTSKSLAKATLAAGYALLSDYDETLVVCDGTHELDISALTLVISNGWTLAGENDRDSSIIKLKQISRNSYTVLKLTDAVSEIRDVTFDLNDVSFSGPPITNPKGKFTRCAFLNSNNTSADGSSALFRISDTCAPIFTNCVFRNAKITRNGGSVFWFSETTSWPTIIGCSFIDCVAGTSSTGARGTIYGYRANCHLRNCLFLRNIVYATTDNAYGSTKYNNVVTSSGTRTFKVENCSFIDCQIRQNSTTGALGVGAGGTVQAVNCFAYGTTNTLGTANLMTNVFSSGSITFTHCASDKLLPGVGNVALTDGAFSYRSRRNDDYTVTRGPTVNGGTNLTWMSSAYDLMDRPRIIGSRVDIGCYELETSPATRFLIQ